MNKKGFTLTEILIVLVVAGILLALILPNTLKAIERGNMTAHQSNLNSINVAIFMCYSEQRSWDACDTSDELIDDGYIEEWPESPFGGAYAIKDKGGDIAGKIAYLEGGDVPGEEAPAP